jgi:DNA-binding beta-propeller fold protein YncE
MKRVLLTAVAVALAVGATVFGQSAVPEIPFDANADVLQFPVYGEVAGVASDSKGNIYAYMRVGMPTATLGHERTFYHGKSRLFKFDSTGKYMHEVAREIYAADFAQNVRVDAKDNVWLVDAGSNMVVQFDPEGTFLHVFGRKPESIPVRQATGGVPARAIDPLPPPPAPAAPGAAAAAAMPAAPPGSGSHGHSFNKPSDVAWDKAGNVYIADGFGTNNRIAKFTPDGNFSESWGQTGSANGQFNRIRGIAIDAAGNIYVADSGNTRIQVLDPNGKYLREITNIGTPMAICISGGSPQYLYSSNSNDVERLDNGEIYKISLDGKVVGQFGRAGRLAREFNAVNSLDCRTDNNLLVGEVGSWRVQRVTLKR